MSFLLTNKRHTEREREETVSDQFLEYCFLKKISDFYRLCILKKKHCTELDIFAI